MPPVVNLDGPGRHSPLRAGANAVSRLSIHLPYGRTYRWQPGLVVRSTGFIVALLQKPECFANDLARGLIETTPHLLVHQILELLRERHIHEISTAATK